MSWRTAASWTGRIDFRPMEPGTDATFRLTPFPHSSETRAA
jgi:hypothetical protein